MRTCACLLALALLLSPAAAQMKADEISNKSLSQLMAEVGRLDEQMAALKAAKESSTVEDVKKTVQAAIERREAKIGILKQIVALRELLDSNLLDSDERGTVRSQISTLIAKFREHDPKAASGATSVPPATAAPSHPAAHGLGGMAEPAPPAPAVSAPPAVAPAPAVSATPRVVPATPPTAQASGGPSGLTHQRPPSGGKLVRTIVGFEQAGASASQHKQTYFLNLFVNTPVKWEWDPRLSSRTLSYGEDIDLGPRFRTWADLRVTSVPQQINSSVAEFANTFAQRVGGLKVNEVVQSAEFLAGLELRFMSGRSPFRSADASAIERYSLSAIIGAGVITPMTPKDSVQIFQVPTNQPEFFTRFPQVIPGSTQFVAFTLPDRDRFFRQAYFGLRLQTHYLDYAGKASRYRPPAMIDITYGFNESVTGGRIRGGVFRIEGFIPLPYTTSNWVYLYGTALFKPVKPNLPTPFLLDAAPAGTLPTDPNAVVITVPQIDRDYYRLGIGMDFIRLVAKIRQDAKEKKIQRNVDACTQADKYEKALCQQRAREEQ